VKEEDETQRWRVLALNDPRGGVGGGGGVQSPVDCLLSENALPRSSTAAPGSPGTRPAAAAPPRRRVSKNNTSTDVDWTKSTIQVEGTSHRTVTTNRVRASVRACTLVDRQGAFCVRIVVLDTTRVLKLPGRNRVL
jgi:hypothetical protein